LSKSILSNILFENPVPLNMHLQMQPRSANVEKMSGIITKRICQRCRLPDDLATLNAILLLWSAYQQW